MTKKRVLQPALTDADRERIEFAKGYCEEAVALLERERDKWIEDARLRDRNAEDYKRQRDEARAKLAETEDAMSRVLAGDARIRRNLGPHDQAPSDLVRQLERELDVAVRQRDAYRDALHSLARTAKPVVDRLWKTGESQPAEVIRLGEAVQAALAGDGDT